MLGQEGFQILESSEFWNNCRFHWGSVSTPKNLKFEMLHNPELFAVIGTQKSFNS
jgi:hypothetical protein